jgi:hypothetical protein
MDCKNIDNNYFFVGLSTSLLMAWAVYPKNEVYHDI